MGRGAGHDLRVSEERWERNYESHKWKENESPSVPREGGAGRRRGSGRVGFRRAWAVEEATARVEEHRTKKRRAQVSALGPSVCLEEMRLKRSQRGPR